MQYKTKGYWHFQMVLSSRKFFTGDKKTTTQKENEAAAHVIKATLFPGNQHT